MVDNSFEGFHLTALDARRFDFGCEFRGDDRARADQFREQVAGELERLTRAYQELEQHSRYEHEQLQMFRDAVLNEALSGAQQLRIDVMAQAQLPHHLERQLTELNAAESGPLSRNTEPRSLSAARAESAEAQEVHSVPERLPERVPERLLFTPPWLAVVEDEP